MLPPDTGGWQFLVVLLFPPYCIFRFFARIVIYISKIFLKSSLIRLTVLIHGNHMYVDLYFFVTIESTSTNMRFVKNDYQNKNFNTREQNYWPNEDEMIEDFLFCSLQHTNLISSLKGIEWEEKNKYIQHTWLHPMRRSILLHIFQLISFHYLSNFGKYWIIRWAHSD